MEQSGASELVLMGFIKEEISATIESLESFITKISIAMIISIDLFQVVIDFSTCSKKQRANQMLEVFGLKYCGLISHQFYLYQISPINENWLESLQALCVYCKISLSIRQA